MMESPPKLGIEKVSNAASTTEPLFDKKSQDQLPSEPASDNIKWYQLWVIKSAIAGCVVFALAYGAGLVVGVQGIQSIVQMAFDPEIETLQSQHLALIKRAHKFRQETYQARLEKIIPDSIRTGAEKADEAMIIAWLKSAKVDEFVPLELVKVETMPDFNAQEPAVVTWLGQSTLRILQYKVMLPELLVRKEFQDADEIISRNQGIRATWHETIQPTIIAIQGLIVLLTVVILGGAMTWGFGKFRKNIELVVRGFREWSERDSSFRFRHPWTGELAFLADRFNQMADEVEDNRNRRMYLEKVASWQIIARKLAHEIKNPLTPIQMMVTQLHRRYKGDDEEFRALLEDSKTIISEEVAGLRRMVDNFSRFAQMPQPKMIRQDLCEMVRKVVELERAGFPQHRINFHSELSKALVNMDAQLIKQVLINIIKNAAEASIKKQARIDVTIQSTRGQYYIIVADDGPGIPKELQERVFEAYFTTKHSGPTPGMGLGLAICQKVMLEHGGDLKVESVPGDTRFILTLPIS